MDATPKIKRQSALLRHQVQDVLRNEIIAGRLVPGERLVEQRLCAALDVSRTVLREAIRQLEAEGLVEMFAHRGASVASVDVEEARQIYEVRGALEGLAVQGFARYAGAADRRALREVVGELEDAERVALSGPEILAIKQRFYGVMLNACRNDIVCQTLAQLNNRISLLRSLSLSRAGRLRETVFEIKAIVEALERGDEQAASQASIRHVENAARHALRTLRERLESPTGKDVSQPGASQ